MVSSRAASVDRSTRPLSEVTRHLVIPEGIVDTGWFEVEARCAEWGDRFDTWQDGAGQLILGLDANGRYVCTVGGVTISIPRQVAKTFIVGRIVFALCTIFSGLTVLWTAHRQQTATMTFQKLAGLSKRPSVAPYMAVNRSDGVRTSNGQQEIEFRNGSKIMFGAREQGFGRGFDEVDVEVFDESQILTEKALEDMVPATNQSRSPRGALLIYMGTPPRPVDPGEVFTQRRDKALARKGEADIVGVGGNALYIETSADENVGKPGGPGLYDADQIAKANPSYPHRTPQESIDRMRENLPSEDAWRREALGVWDERGTSKRLIPAKVWTDLAVDVAPAGVRSFGVAFSYDGKRQSVAGATKHDAGIHVELIGIHSGSTDAGITALADWLTADPKTPNRWRTAATIVISGRSHATVLYDELVERGVSKKVLQLATTADYMASGATFQAAVTDKTLTYPRPADPALDALTQSVAVSDKKNRGTTGAWGWQATTPDGDETPVEAASLALWGAKTSKRNPARKVRAVTM